MSRAPRRPGRMLALIALVVLAPVALALVFYYVLPPTSFTNYGELLPTRPAPAIRGTRSDGGAFRLDEPSGRWLVVVAAPGTCDAACERRLYATRQARTMQGKDSERVQRIWLVIDGGTPAAATLAEHRDVAVVEVRQSEAAKLPRGPEAIHLVDPLGNQVLAWPGDPDIKALGRDIGRLLRASRIG